MSFHNSQEHFSFPPGCPESVLIIIDVVFIFQVVKLANFPLTDYQLINY